MNDARSSRPMLPPVALALAPPTVVLGLYWLGVSQGWWLNIRGLWPLLWGWAPCALAFAILRQSPLGTGVISLLMGLTLLIGSLVFNFEAARVQGPSMRPTLHEGDVLLVDRTDDRLERFGVYVATPDDNKEQPVVKRVAGLPGEHITVRYYRVFADGEEVYPRDGSPRDVWYTQRPARARMYGGGMHLGDDEYFLLGDNPPQSRDSRSFGPVKRESFQGRVVWSLKGARGFGPFSGR